MVIPPLVGNFIGLFKSTTLVVVIGLFDLLNSAGVNPGQYGLTDVTTPCQTLAGCPADPAGYLFWDDVHITTAGHQIVAGAFAAALAPVPEAQTWAMLLAGLALLGLARRARG